MQYFVRSRRLTGSRTGFGSPDWNVSMYDIRNIVRSIEAPVRKGKGIFFQSQHAVQTLLQSPYIPRAQSIARINICAHV